MQIFSDLSKQVVDKPTVVTIGNFDGVHLGHQQLIRYAVHSAKQQMYCSTLVTFTPHPRLVTSNSNFLCLTTDKEKLAHFKQLGLDLVVMARFTVELQKTSARDFIDLLVNHLCMQELWVGYDFVFGYQQEGTPEVLKSLSLQYGFNLYRMPPVLVNNQPVSSRRIRDAIANADLAQASICLGR